MPLVPPRGINRIRDILSIGLVQTPGQVTMKILLATDGSATSDVAVDEIPRALRDSEPNGGRYSARRSHQSPEQAPEMS